MLLKALLLSVFISFSVPKSLLNHALHLSSFEMTIHLNHSSSVNDEFAEVMLRVFQDDFRDAIKNANLDLIAVANEQFVASRQKEIEQYFQEHLQLDFDGQKSLVNLVEGRGEADMYYFKFDLIFPKKWQKCSLRADYLMELFDDQSNVAIVILAEEKQYFRFTKKESVFLLAIE